MRKQRPFSLGRERVRELERVSGAREIYIELFELFFFASDRQRKKERKKERERHLSRCPISVTFLRALVVVL